MTIGTRIRNLVNSQVESSDAATFILKLPKSGALHQLMVRVRMTNGATEAHGVTILDVLDQVEVIGNGSQVIYSLIPEVIEKRFELDNGHALPMVVNARAAAVQEMTFPINFGRSAFDPEMWLPLERFGDLELKLQYSPNIAATAGFATGTFTIDVIALISIRPPSNYLGTIVTKALENFTSAASGVQTVEHHLAHPLKDIVVYAYEAAIADDVDVTSVEIQANDGEFSLYNQGWAEMLRLNAMWQPTAIKHSFLAFLQDNDTLDTRISVPTGLNAANGGTALVATDIFQLIQLDVVAGDRVTINFSEADVTAGAETHVTLATDTVADIQVSKEQVSYAARFPFDFDPNPLTWLQTRELSALKTLITQGAAGADVRVSVAELQLFTG